MPVSVSVLKDKTPSSALKIQEFLAENAKEAFSIDEVAAGISMSKASAQNGLRHLLKRKQVNRGRLGRAYYYHHKGGK